ncbi:hypothetical protein AAHC03_01195 [Spirometra sp. Aus1]|nr:unnamed protein product [Spirometra erinaceieuropaei]
MNKLKAFKKAIQDVREGNETALEASKKELVSIPELPELATLQFLKSLTLSHNKIPEIPHEIASLQYLEHLNLFNNCISNITPKVCELRNLRSLILGLNKINTLPRGFGAFPALEVLDLTYNNLNENSLPDNFFNLGTLRALYLSDNDFEKLPPGIGNLANLEIIGKLTHLKELHLQGNRLRVLPPELGNLNFSGTAHVVKLTGNYWVSPIEDQLQVGISHVFDYIRSETYRFLHDRHMASMQDVPPKTDKSKKLSRKR